MSRWLLTAAMYACVSGSRLLITSAHGNGASRLSKLSRVRQARLHPAPCRERLVKEAASSGAGCSIVGQRNPSLGRMPASVPRQLLQAVLRRAAGACGRSCLREALPARWQRREYGLPVRIVHRDERTKQPAGESQGASRPACPDTCASRGPALRRRLRHPWRDRGFAAKRRKRSRRTLSFSSEPSNPRFMRGCSRKRAITSAGSALIHRCDSFNRIAAVGSCLARAARVRYPRWRADQYSPIGLGRGLTGGGWE